MLHQQPRSFTPTGGKHHHHATTAAANSTIKPLYFVGGTTTSSSSSAKPSTTATTSTEHHLSRSSCLTSVDKLYSLNIAAPQHTAATAGADHHQPAGHYQQLRFTSHIMQPNGGVVPHNNAAAGQQPPNQLNAAVHELCKSLSSVKAKDLTPVVDAIRNRDHALSSGLHATNQQYFGQPLSSMPRAHVQFTIEGTRINGQVPWLLSQCIETLSATKLLSTVEGVFRISGNVQRIKQLKEQITKCGPTIIHSQLVKRVVNIHDVISLLKDFFASIPGSVLTAELRTYFWQTLSSNLSNDAKSRCIALLSFLLPPVNRDTLLYYVQFLHSVGLNGHANKMTHENLATCCVAAFPIPRQSADAKPIDLQYEQSVRLSLLQALIQRPGLLLLGSGISSTSACSDHHHHRQQQIAAAEHLSRSHSSTSRFVTRSTSVDMSNNRTTAPPVSSYDTPDAVNALPAAAAEPSELFPTVRFGEQVYTFNSSPSISPRKRNPNQSADRFRVEPKLMRSGGRVWTPGKRKTPAGNVLANRRNSGIFSRFRTSPLVRRDSNRSGSGSPARLRKKPSLRKQQSATGGGAEEKQHAAVARIERRDSKSSCTSVSTHKLKNNITVNNSGSKISLDTMASTSNSENSGATADNDDDDDNADVELVESMLTGHDAGSESLMPNVQRQRLDFGSCATPTPTLNVAVPAAAAAAADTNSMTVEDAVEPNSHIKLTHKGSIGHFVSNLRRRSALFFGSKSNVNSSPAPPEMPTPTMMSANASSALFTQRYGNNSDAATTASSSTFAAAADGGGMRNEAELAHHQMIINNNSGARSGIIGRPNLLNYSRHIEPQQQQAATAAVAAQPNMLLYMAQQANNNNNNLRLPVMPSKQQHADGTDADGDADMSMSSID